MPAANAPDASEHKGTAGLATCEGGLAFNSIAFPGGRRLHKSDGARQPGARSNGGFGPIADTLVEDLKRLGRKTGAGWYDYDAAGTPTEADTVTHVIYRASDAAGITRVERGREEIAQRAVLAMIMEAIRILEEGIAARPQDIDLVMVHGYGFPRWRGGLMHYADQLTPAVILSQIAALAKADPLSWSVPGLLQQLVKEDRSFDSLNREGSLV